MPMYDYQCTECAAITTRFRKIVDRNDLLICECHGVMKLAILSAPHTKIQEEAHYLCPATGEEVTSWRQRNNLMAKHDLVQADPDRDAEIHKRTVAKKKKRDELAKDYLPKDLRDQLSTIGATAEKAKDRFTI